MAFNWDRLKRLQRMERNGFDYVLAGFERGRQRTETLSRIDQDSLSRHLGGDPEKFPLSPEAFAPATSEELIDEAAILFALSSVRYRNKWDEAHDPTDVTGHIRRLRCDPRLTEALEVIHQGASWSGRTDIPRMFFREAMKLHYIVNMTSNFEENLIGEPAEVLGWLLEQEGWELAAARASDTVNRYEVLRKTAQKLASAKKVHRANPGAHVGRRKLQARPPKITVGGQLTRAEGIQRQKLPPS